MNKQNINKAKQYKKAYLGVILAGIVFLIIGIFNSSIWFDEAFTASLTCDKIYKVFGVSADYVNPPVYYVLVAVWAFIFGNSMISLRIFSMLAIVILAILGYTHIRKDFSRKTGLLFTILAFVMPFSYKYALQLSNYSYTILFTALAAIYGYRVVQYFRNNEYMHITTAVAFMAYSMLAMYTNYGAVLAVAIINVVMLLRIKYIEKNVDFTSAVKNNAVKIWVILLVLQVILYIPGFVLMFRALTRIYAFPGVLIPNIVFSLYGVLIWAGSYILTRVKFEFNVQKLTNIAIGVLVAFAFGYAVYVVATSFDKSNTEWKSLVESKIEENDVFITSNNQAAAMTMQFPYHATLLYMKDSMEFGKLYDAFGGFFYEIDNLDLISNYDCRLWLIDSDELYDEISKLGEVKTVMEFEMNMSYYSRYNSHKVRLLECKFSK